MCSRGEEGTGKGMRFPGISWRVKRRNAKTQSIFDEADRLERERESFAKVVDRKMERDDLMRWEDAP